MRFGAWMSDWWSKALRVVAVGGMRGYWRLQLMVDGAGGEW